MIDLDLPHIAKPEKRAYRFDQKVWALFDRYVEAAQMSNSEVTPDMVLELILKHHLNKDKKFRRWLDGKPERQAIKSKRLKSPK